MREKSDHDLLIEIHGVLLGANGQGGLLRDYDALKQDYCTFKRWVLSVSAFLAGSGLLGYGVFELLKPH